MRKNTDLMHKPNQTITIKKDITITQRKAYNVILQKAWFDLKNEDKNKRDFLFSMAELKERAGIKATDNWHLKKCLEQLSDIRVETIDDKDNWGFFHLISSVRKEGDNLLIELSGRITEALYKNNYYTTLDLLTIKTLNGKHSVPIYELAIRYSKKQIPEMTINELRELTGTNNKKSYDNFNNLKKYVLIPAIEEINEKTDIKITFSTQKRGKKVISVKFDLVLKNQEKDYPIPKLNDPNQIDMFMCEELRLKIKNTLNIDISTVELQNLVDKHSESKVNYVVENLYKTLPLSAPSNQRYNYFKCALIQKWNFNNKDVISRIHNFDQRVYPDEFYDQLHNNSKKAD